MAIHEWYYKCYVNLRFKFDRLYDTRATKVKKVFGFVAPS